MKLSNPHKYVITAESSGSYSVVSPDGKANFIAPVTQRNPKLYTFSSGNRLLYIGQTIQGMAARMRLGFQADGSSGYYGYGWRQALRQADLYIWCLEDATDDEETLALECIESEVVFLSRTIYGQWPEYQTEIHFHQSSQVHRELAATIFSVFEKPNI